MDLEQQVINYQFALSYYEYNNNLALHRTAMMLGAIMFFIGFIQILFVTVVKDVKTDDYFALNTIFKISLPGFFLALLGAFIITITLLLTPSLNHDYSPKFLNSQVQKEFYKFNPPYLNKAARQPLEAVTTTN